MLSTTLLLCLNLNSLRWSVFMSPLLFITFVRIFSPPSLNRFSITSVFTMLVLSACVLPLTTLILQVFYLSVTFLIRTVCAFCHRGLVLRSVVTGLSQQDYCINYQILFQFPPNSVAIWNKRCKCHYNNVIILSSFLHCLLMKLSETFKPAVPNNILNLNQSRRSVNFKFILVTFWPRRCRLTGKRSPYQVFRQSKYCTSAALTKVGKSVLLWGDRSSVKNIGLCMIVGKACLVLVRTSTY